MTAQLFVNFVLRQTLPSRARAHGWEVTHDLIKNHPFVTKAPASKADELVDRFAAALKEKLRAAEAKYGHDDAWLRDDWRDDLKSKLRHHVFKGDPRDVAAYCAFAWHHDWSVGFDLDQGSPLSALDPFGDRGAARASLASHEAPAEGAGEREVLWKALQKYTMTNMGDGDGHGFPLIDLMSNDGTTIDTGREEMLTLADHLSEALEKSALRARSSAPEAREGEAVAWMRLTAGKITHLTHCEMPGYVPLYTHPAAPSADKLLEAESLFDALRDESWDLRCFNVPTGGDDFDIGWRVIGHWQAEPRERTIAEVFTDDPAEAVRQALAALKAEGS